MEPEVTQLKPIYQRIDHYWNFVGEIVGDDGEKKYPQLFALARCVLYLSHGNAVPERGFSLLMKTQFKVYDQVCLSNSLNLNC